MKQNNSETQTCFFPADRLVACRVAREVLADVAALTRRWHAALRDQALRASESAMLNIAEGASQPAGSGAKRRHYDIALASAGEVAAALDAAVALGRSTAAEIGAARVRVARLGALLGGLVRSARR